MNGQRTDGKLQFTVANETDGCNSGIQHRPYHTTIPKTVEDLADHGHQPRVTSPSPRLPASLAASNPRPLVRPFSCLYCFIYDTMTALKNKSLLFSVYFYWLLGVAVVQSTSLITKIESASESCLMIRTGEFDASRQRYLEGSFEQIDDRGTDTLIVVIMDDHDTLIYESRHKRSDAFRHRVQPYQTYWLCVQNQPPAEGGGEEKKEKEYDDDDDYYSYGAGSTTRTVGFEYNLVYDETPPTLPPQPGPIPVASYTTIWMNKVRHSFVFVFDDDRPPRKSNKPLPPPHSLGSLPLWSSLSFNFVRHFHNNRPPPYNINCAIYRIITIT